MEAIEEVLTRGVEKIYPSKEALEKVLHSSKKIRLYNGIDPTGSQLHLGHMVVLRKLHQFQDLGHQVILLIGDFTGMIGDPSGKTEARKPMTREQLLANAKTYKQQASKILRFDGDNPVEIKYNSQWLDKLNYAEIIRLTSMVTYSQVIERDMFQQRMKEGKDLFLNELLYPLMQGYDSIAMDVDLEIGGSDQIFNMLMGRTLMKKIKNKEKFVLATKLLAEPGKPKMSKSEGTFVALNDTPEEMFGKIMAWPDEMLNLGFELLTDIPMENVGSSGTNPMDLKKKLACEIVAQLHSRQAAQKAQEEFERVFQKKETPPEEIPVFMVTSKKISLIDLLVSSGLAPSRSGAKRLIEQGAVDVNNNPITNYPFGKAQGKQLPITLKDGTVIKVGKRNFIRIKIK